MRTIQVSPRAALEIERADDWWFENRPKAPGAVGDELASAFAQVAANPEACPVIAARGLRRLFLRRIRFHLYYRIRDEDIVDVLSLWQANRGADPEL
ncbi:MAG TPA: type II toxin-antitoxin system RelE/ParE family toxin [Kofleriaceae bacterium]|nr:type II toxin-antitoxin system RelE/ParE family toxin [Kofleriaceae bacterium]